VRLALQARPWPMPRQNTSLRLSAFRLRFSFVLSFRHPCQATHANASTGIGLLQIRSEHRIKSVMTIDVSDVT
jgi:hypothetical protein